MVVFWPGGPGGAEGVYTDMEKWTRIRLALREGQTSKRELMRREGIHWDTLQKIQDHPEPPGYRMDLTRPKPKLGPYLEVIAQIIKDDKSVPKKQRHTATRIYHCLKEMGYTGKYTQVKEAVREIKRVSREVYMPLVHRPGEAQVDFGYALANVSGVLRKVALFIMALPYSDAFFMAAFEKECSESYWEGHVRAFEFFGGVPHRISYDNTRVLVSKITGPHERELTDGFLKLQSLYLFQEHFCRVRRPNEKGVVEGMVKYARQNFMVPVPQVKDLAELNAMLAQKCRDDLNRRLRGKGGAKSELLQEDQAAFTPLASITSSMPAASSPPGPIPCLWSASTTMTTRCRSPVRTTRFWPRAMWTKWCYATMTQSWPGTPDPGRRRGCFSTTATTCPCWSASPAPWIMPAPWLVWTCPSVSRS